MICSKVGRWGCRHHDAPGTTISGPVAVPTAASVLAPYVEAGIFGPFEVQLAASMARLVPTASAEALLAVAIAARAPRFGHVCAELIVGLRPWPATGTGAAPPICPGRPREDWGRRVPPFPTGVHTWCHPRPGPPSGVGGSRLYLQRYRRDENAVATDLTRRARPARRGQRASPDTLSQFVLEEALDGLSGPDDGAEPDLQRLAARRAHARDPIIAGGPGTGKTRTVARLLAWPIWLRRPKARAWSWPWLPPPERRPSG